MSSRHTYDAADYIVPPQVGQNGHSERVQCRVQSGHFRALGTMARSGVFPWEERADVIRWCIKHGLQELARLEPGMLKSVMSQANAAERIARDHIYRQKFSETFAALHESVSYYVANQMPDQAALVVRDVRRELEAIPQKHENDRVWRARYLKELDKYAYLETGTTTSPAVLPAPPPPPTRVAWDDDGWSDDDE